MLLGLRQLLVPAYDWIEPTQLATTPTTSPSAIISAIATPTISTIDTPTITPTTLITTTTTSIVSPTTSSTILPSASEAPYTPAEVGVGIGIVLGIVLVPATIVALVVYVKKGVNKREAERVARLRRAVNPEEARRAEEYVRNAWAEGDRRRKEKEEAFELQEVRGQSYGTAESVVEPEPAYRHPRMDWK